MKVYKRQHGRPDKLAPFDRRGLEEFAPPPPITIESEEQEAEDSSSGDTPQDTFDAEALREEVLAEARAEAERRVQLAYQEGLRRGEQAGRAAFDERVAGSIEALETLCGAAAEMRNRYLEETVPQVVSLVRQLAAHVIRREVQEDEGWISRTVRSVLAKLVDAQQLTVRLNPLDLEVLRNEEGLLREQFPHLEKITYIPDDTVTRGGATVESSTLFVDARVETLLDNVLERLEDGQ